MPIYTKVGDSGKTTLINGHIFSKTAKVFEVLGTLDELNASLGILHSYKKPELTKIIQSLQADLFTVGAFFAGKKYLKEDETYVKKRIKEIEMSIDKIEKLNTPLKNFILPGGKPEASYLHLARAIARRLERVYLSYSIVPNAVVIPIIETYFNRLSDYLFVLARYYNQKGKKDIVWKN
jgi:cob(I)alamin adenosyltransferase